MSIKVAICFSGYYRSFSDPFDDFGVPIYECWLEFTKEIHELSNGEISFDFYGHGWNINNLPSSINFKNIKSDDQIEYFVSWISENPDTRLLSLPKLIRSHKDKLWQGEVLGYLIGQHLSMWEGISIIEEEYDYIIKTRWDAIPHVPQANKQLFVDFLKKRHENILFVEEISKYSSYFLFFRDYSFLISGPKLIKHIRSNDISKLIDTINLKNLEDLDLRNKYNSNGIIVCEMVAGVELWLSIFCELNIDFRNVPIANGGPFFKTSVAVERYNNAKYSSHELFGNKYSLLKEISIEKSNNKE